jgi:putative DNA primase/helicase
LLIPFPVTIEAGKVDKHLPAKLEQELPGILAWLVKGCLKWQKEGLMVPPEVKEATQEYRAETDILPQFLADSCTLDKAARVPSRNLYEAYKSWAVENTDEVLTPKAFGLMLKTAGYKASKSDSVRYWTALRLKSTSSPSASMKAEEPQSKA